VSAPDLFVIYDINRQAHQTRRFSQCTGSAPLSICLPPDSDRQRWRCRRHKPAGSDDCCNFPQMNASTHSNRTKENTP
jgi:hypothetical protein